MSCCRERLCLNGYLVFWRGSGATKDLSPQKLAPFKEWTSQIFRTETKNLTSRPSDGAGLSPSRISRPSEFRHSRNFSHLGTANRGIIPPMGSLVLTTRPRPEQIHQGRIAMSEDLIENICRSSGADPCDASSAAFAQATKVADTPKGKAYADAKGMTLYTFDKDAEGKSACNGPTPRNWPPLMAAADARALGRLDHRTRDDGSKMWALKGKPLYTFAKDHQARRHHRRRLPQRRLALSYASIPGLSCF